MVANGKRQDKGLVGRQGDKIVPMPEPSTPRLSPEQWLDLAELLRRRAIEPGDVSAEKRRDLLRQARNLEAMVRHRLWRGKPPAVLSNDRTSI